ncbi:MAG: c-type cytochrome biogenesis protein CcmI, partial [Amphiplicatus sp.]
MMLWFIIAGIAAGALITLAWPFFSAPRRGPSFDETDYLAAQLDDVERDLARGVITEDEAETARLEAKRRLLAAARAEKSPPPAISAVAANLRRGAIMSVGAVPLAAIALYLGIGASGDLGDALTTQAKLEAAVTKEDAQYTDWIALAEAHAQAGERGKAAEILARARERYQNAPFVIAEIAAAEARLLGEAAPRRGPTSADVAAAASMSEDDRRQMILGMVESLAA